MKTILVIEDNEDILENLTEFLEIKGYKVVGAADGKSGVELALELVPDLVICDVRMQIMDGYEVLHALLCAARTHDIPFIFSTSMSERIDKEEALRLGADDYIVKPYELNELLGMTEKWISSGSSRRE